MEFPNFGTQSPSSSTNLTASNRKRKAKEYVDIVPRKKIYFRGPYCRQDFAFQDSVIHSMIKNPTSTKLYEKLIHFCKYFFSKNPIVVIPHLEFKHGKHRWKAVRNCITTRIDLANVLHKLWITDTVYGRNKVTTEIPWIFNLTASLVLKIYKCDVTLDIHCMKNYVLQSRTFHTMNDFFKC
uniref:Uncharacterized protein n=1 Tax=Panagrolaimus davidi TaxID=227884 RepID=A0A914QY82_9BILA